MKEVDIRRSLMSRLRQHDQEVMIREEMVIPGRDARIDIVAINGELHGFEIKSDRDTLKRLQSQSSAYGALFDRVTLVTASVHVQHAKELIPEWWGVCVALEDKSGINMKEERSALKNNSVSPYTVVGLLRRCEVEAALRLCGGKTRGHYLHELNRELVNSLSMDELKGIVRQKLKARQLSLT